MPLVAVIAGSGITIGTPTGDSIQFDSMPGVPATTVAGHNGTIGMQQIGTQQALVMSGRLHQYEGHSQTTLARPLEYLKSQGVTHLIVTSAVGALNRSLQAADVTIIDDVIGMIDSLGTAGRFPVNRDWAGATREACLRKGLGLRSVTYVQTRGPQYETRAEIRMFRRMGADVIGMSMVPELTAARTLGLSCIALAVVTNTTSEVQLPVLGHHHVLHTAAQAARTTAEVIESAIFAA